MTSTHAIVYDLDAAYNREQANGNGSKDSAGSGLALTWENLSYSIEVKNKAPGFCKKEVTELQVLTSLTGGVLPGESICVMGTSGSGKTSFLNVVSGRRVVGDVKGKVRLNGEPRGVMFRRLSAYVEQDDFLFANLTVEESFYFTAWLRLPKTMTREEREGRANAVIDQLGLNHVRKSRVGSPEQRGVSGGERKRCSIGLELITKPAMLFLDEPTSGLDAYTAYHVMESITGLTRSGDHSVIATIHQPRAKTFLLFDKALVLSEGQCVFFGPAAEADTFFSKNGYPVPPNENVADHILDVTTVDQRNEAVLNSSRERVEKLVQAYGKSALATTAASSVKALDHRGGAVPIKDVEQTSRWNHSMASEFGILIQRAWLNITREPRAAKATTFQAIMMAFIVGVVFYDLGKDQIGARDRQGALFFALLNQSFGPLSAALYVFHKEKPVFRRERAAGAYRVSSYYLSKSLADTPVQLVPAMLFVAIAYWMVGFNVLFTRFLGFGLVVLLTVLTAVSYGLVISAATPTYEVASVFAPVCLVILIMLGGFYINTESIPDWLVWLEVLSFMKYGYNALLINEFSGTSWTCDFSASAQGGAAEPCMTTGQEILDSLNVGHLSFWEEIGKLAALCIGFRVVAYILLRALSKVTVRFETDESESESESDSKAVSVRDAQL